MAEGNGGTLGVAFVQDDGVWFSRATLSGAAVPSDWSPRQIATSAAVSELAISYAPEGMRTDVEEAGGWYVAWMSDREIQGIRISELDGTPLEARPMRLLAASVSAARPQPGRFVVEGRGVTRVLFHSLTNSSIEAIPAFCGPLVTE
jgi:hypothetical protein